MKKILVTEWIDGFNITDVKTLRKNGFSLKEIDKKMFEAFGEQIFITGFVHADPHPGNGKYKLTFIALLHNSF